MRSWLFVPGNNEKALEKSLSLESDIIIFDLEDAVALHEKNNARILVQKVLERSKKVNYVRTNHLYSPFFKEDLNGIVQSGLTGIVLPKVEKKEDVMDADKLLNEWEQRRNIPINTIRMVPLIESALGVYHAVEIAKASPRIKNLMFGAVDFTFDINTSMTKSGLEILYARSQLVIASRVAGLEPPIDTVYIDIHDEEGLRTDSLLAKQLGFQGKIAIHPRQVKVINEIFTPTKQEIENARRVVLANEQAEQNGLGVFQLEGKMIDLPIVNQAKRILDICRNCK